MNEKFYYDGNQIKNYLIGFASVFSEIPYQDRNGVIKTVPIHYGSPSDVVSYLESIVDNVETTNRNRLKDVTVPLLSFRMIGIERNIEKRRAPLDTITVDLRPLGYNTGYVTMMPSPYKFTMELVCWASSDYQAFEITEQIIPYFNSPQQVVIEPLPRCPVSKTEIFLDNIEIDTDPESQKCGAIITMTFSLTGWFLTQPRIWSTNMKFELSILDAGTSNSMTKNDAYSFDKGIIDLNNIPLQKNEVTLTIETFIKTNPNFNDKYAIDYGLYKLLVEKNIIVDDNSNLNVPTTVEFNNTIYTITNDNIYDIIHNVNELKSIYNNRVLMDLLQQYDIETNVITFKKIFNEPKETILVYLKLLEYNLVSKNFNLLSEISNSEKLNLFGTVRYDLESILTTIKLYLSIFESIMIMNGEYTSNNNNVSNCKFTKLNEYIIICLLGNYVIDNAVLSTEFENALKVMKNKFNIDVNIIKQMYIELNDFINSIEKKEKLNETEISQVPLVDSNNIIIEDINKDGFINSIDLTLTNATVDDPTLYNFRLIDNILYHINSDAEIGFMTSIKILLFLLEKGNYNEIYDYFKLLKLDMIHSTSDLIVQIQDDSFGILENFGYQKDELEQHLLYIRFFNITLKNIILDYKNILISKLNDLRISNYLDSEQININHITYGLYLKLFLNGLSDSDLINKKIELNKYIIDNNIDYYLEYIVEFEYIILMLQTNNIFKESIGYETIWLDREFPLVKVIIDNKYI